MRQIVELVVPQTTQHQTARRDEWRLLRCACINFSLPPLTSGCVEIAFALSTGSRVGSWACARVVETAGIGRLAIATFSDGGNGGSVVTDNTNGGVEVLCPHLPDMWVDPTWVVQINTWGSTAGVGITACNLIWES